MIVERLGRSFEVIAQSCKSRSTGVPVGHAVGRSVLDEEIARCLRGLKHHVLNVVAAAERGEFFIRYCLQKFELLRIAGDDP